MRGARIVLSASDVNVPVERSARGISVATLLGLVLLAKTATASGPPARGGLDLTWDAPPGCPPASEVTRSVDRIVGESPVSARDSVIRVRGAVRRDADQFLIDLEMIRGDALGRRTVSARDCRLVTDAAAVMIAMLVLEPMQRSEDSVQTHDEPAVVDAPRAEEERAESEPLPHSRAASGRPTLRAGLGAFVDSATLPSAAPGLLATLAWDGERHRLEGALGGTMPARSSGRTTLDDRVLGVDAGLWFGGVRGEIHSKERPFVVGARAGADFGLIHASGVGAWVPNETNSFWMAVAGGPTARLKLGERVSLRVVLEAVVPLVRPTFTIDLEPVHRPAPLATRSTLSAEIRF